MVPVNKAAPAEALQGLEPRALWRHFDAIRRIPRCSGNEAGVLSNIKAEAARWALEFRQDATGNLVVSKPASPGRDKAPCVVLQAHVDMVCEKNRGVVFDFTRDAIELAKDGEFLRAARTTLGADNGIGVAAMLAVLEDKNLMHGPLEALFTVDEESGLTGALGLDPTLLSGRLLINLDSEGPRTLCIGCAGGGTVEAELPAPRAALTEGRAFRTTVSGLKGGHSGIDIHLERGNAVKILARLLWKARQRGGFRLVAFSGGDKHNAIPREAAAEFVLSGEAAEAWPALAEEEAAALRAEYAARDAGLAVHCVSVPLPGEAMPEEASARLIDLANALPHGVLCWSAEMEDLVEASVTLAKVSLADSARFILSARSSRASQLEAARDQVEAAARLAGATVTRNEGYPGWQPNPRSPLVALLKEAGRELWGEEPRVEAVHAGLEAGIIGTKVPGIDMVSIGPDIRHPHSPDECVHLPSVPDFWALLLRTLEKVAGISR